MGRRCGGRVSAKEREEGEVGGLGSKNPETRRMVGDVQ